jgi:hypothetical protein
MRVKIGPYKNWVGPYQLAEKICFWVKPTVDKYNIPTIPDWVHKFGEFLAHGSIEPEEQVGEIVSWNRKRTKTWLYRFLSWVDSKKERTIYVRIDPWDTWNMDDTLAHIILPMLKQIFATKHGAPYVEDEDVPAYLRSTAAPELTQEEKDTGHTDANHFKRWDWVLSEMIFAFENKIDDSWKEQFSEGDIDFAFKKLDNEMSEMVHGPEHTFKVDRVGEEEYQKRISNGFRLFGKYYESLWD